MDKYTASIEFSNACRSFYFHRVQATESFKENVQRSDEKKKTGKPASSIENALLKLKSEMASLMDQDLNLMEQLLTMNESIEEIKSRRLYGVSKDSLDESLESVGSDSSSSSDSS